MAVRSNSKSSATWKDGIDRSNAGRMEPTDRPSGSQNFRVNRFSQGQDGRPFFDQDRRRMGSGRGRPQCSYCGDMGHWDLATRKMIGLGKQRDGLYYLVALAMEKSLTNHSSSTNQPACNLAISSTDLWHTYATNVHISHKFDYRVMPSIFIGYPVAQLYSPSLTHNSGPIPWWAHDISSSLDSTSHALSPLLSNHTSTPSPTTENDDFSSPSRPSELVIEPSSQIDPNPSPPPSTTLVSSSPVPPFASIPSALPAETPIFHQKHTHPNQPLHSVAPAAISPRQSSSTIMFAPTYKPAYRSFVAQHSAVTEPMSYLEAAAHPECTIGSERLYSIRRCRLSGYLFPTAKIISVRCLLALAATRGWSLHQMDVNNAFFHGDLHEEIYMSPPLGLRRQGEENLVCRLHKSLYGLKQASRQWFAKFSEAIQSAGYAQSRADYSLFTRKQGKSFTAILIYVDDILITGNDPVSIATTKKFLHSHFHLKDLGDLKYFLGIEVSASKNGIFVSQRKYALEIIEDAGLLGAAPIDTPMERGLKLSDKSDLLKDQGRYRRLVGRLIYLTVSRPDIAYAVHVLSRFMHQPRKAHMEATFRVVRYLKNAPGQAEVEYRAMTGACCELTWLRYLLKDLGVLHQEPALLYCDNKASLHIAANPVFHERTRHIEMDCHYIRDKIQDGSIITRHVSSTHQLADILTKSLGKEFFAPMIRKLGVQDIHSPT
ncbi:Retrovirus-related Pol polyprotein from transposon RE1 [Vitis vinifera]|uniref:Retrovirus-related Pol polyprotein from transposon RE1 n=1 Tax=Vitis vinifera TaxID=29760 RepID=A0A438H3V5_VITVI|nr:Retrovirus-related Pol polyprotein from transposon RE1 [Vitis vinifera]